MKLSLNLPDHLVGRLRDDAEALGVSLPALVTAELVRARQLAGDAVESLNLSSQDRAALVAMLGGIEQMRIIDGRDDLPAPEWLLANLEDAERGDLADRLRGGGVAPLAIWGLVMEARR